MFRSGHGLAIFFNEAKPSYAIPTGDGTFLISLIRHSFAYMTYDCVRNKLLLVEFSVIRKLFFHTMLKFWLEAIVFLFGPKFFLNVWSY